MLCAPDTRSGSVRGPQSRVRCDTLVVKGGVCEGICSLVSGRCARCSARVAVFGAASSSARISPPRLRRSRWVSSPIPAGSTTMVSTISPMRACSKPSSTLGVKGQVIQATSSARLRPVSPKEAEHGDKLVVAVGFDFIDGARPGRKAVPAHEVRDYRHAGLRDQAGKPKNVEGLDVRVPAVRLPGRLSVRSDLEGQGLHDRVQRWWSGHPVGDQLHRRLPGGRQGR